MTTHFWSRRWWDVRFLWYFWTAVLCLPLFLLPGKPREFFGKRWDLCDGMDAEAGAP